MFQPYGELFDETYSRYNANMLENQDPFVRFKHDKTGEAMYSNDQDDENVESSRRADI